MRNVSTSHIERGHLTMLMHMPRFTQLTDGFTRRLKNHMHADSVPFMFYNLYRSHQAPCVSSPMPAGFDDYPWSMEEVVMMAYTQIVTESASRRTSAYIDG